MKILALILILHTAQVNSSDVVVQGVEIVESSYDNFASGYKDGWVEGYCQKQTTNYCNVPYPPAPPPMRPQDQDTYRSGYNRGFTDGLRAYRDR